jgi:hypothetical protein
MMDQTMQPPLPFIRHAESDAVRAKAAQLAVASLGHDWYVVASGTVPGVVHHVHAPPDETDAAFWHCDCLWAAYGGTGCSHVRAAQRFAERARRRAARRRARRTLATTAATHRPRRPAHAQSRRPSRPNRPRRSFERAAASPGRRSAGAATVRG